MNALIKRQQNKENITPDLPDFTSRRQHHGENPQHKLTGKLESNKKSKASI